MVLEITYIVFIIMIMGFLVKAKMHLKMTKEGNKNTFVNPRDKKLVIVIVLSIYILYYLIGWLLKTDMLNPVTIRTNGATFSFVGIILLTITSLLVGYIIDVLEYTESTKSKLRRGRLGGNGMV